MASWCRAYFPSWAIKTNHSFRLIPQTRLSVKKMKCFVFSCQRDYWDNVRFYGNHNYLSKLSSVCTLHPRNNVYLFNIPPIFIGNSTIEWVSKSRLLGMTVDEKLTWTQHMLELKKSFAKKLGLLKKSRFLPRNVRQDLYFKGQLSGKLPLFLSSLWFPNGM